MKQNFKDQWLRNLNNYKRQRYDLSDGDKSLCVMAVARETAVELHILPDCDMKGRDLLTDEELAAIGLSKDAQFYLSTMNDTYGYAISKDNFPRRLINAVKDLPVTQLEMPLLVDNREMIAIENKGDKND